MTTEDLAWPSTLPRPQWVSAWIGEAQALTQRTAPPQNRVNLIQLIINALSVDDSLKDIDDTQVKLVVELVLRLFDFLTVTSTDKKKNLRVLTHFGQHFAKLLSSKRPTKTAASNKLLTTALQILSESSAQWHLGGLGFVVDAAVEANKELLTAHLDKIVTTYVNFAINAKEGSTKAVCERFNSLIPQLTANHVKSAILPEFNKHLKRNPDAAHDAVIHFMEHVKLDLSPFLSKDLYPMFLEHLQSKETKHREMAVRAFGKACEATNDANVKIEVVDQICKLLEGPVPQWYQRAGLCGALEFLATSDIGGNSAKIEKTVTTLVNLVQKEINLDALQIELSALGKWIKVSPKDFPKNAIALYKTSLNDNKKPEKHKAFLYSLTHTVASIESQKEKGPLFDELSETIFGVITKVKTKPTTRSEALLALYIVTKMGLNFPKWSQTADKEKVWDYLLSDSSFLFSPEFLPKLEDSYYPFLLKFVEMAILNYFPKVEKCQSFFGLIISVMTRGTWASREPVLQTIDSCHGKAPKLSGCLLTSFDQYLQKLGSEPSTPAPATTSTPTTAPKTTSGQAPNTTSQKTTPAPSTPASSSSSSSAPSATPSSPSSPSNEVGSFRSALKVITSSSLPASSYPLVILLSCHPLVTVPSESLPAAKLIRSLMKRLKVDFEDIFRQNKSAITSLLYGAHGIDHPTVKAYRTAAMDAVCSCSLLLKSRELIYDLVFPYDRLLHLDLWHNLSKDDLGIYNTPEGQVYGGKDSGPKNKAEEQTAKEKAKKEVTDPVELAKIQKILAEEKVVRQQVRLVYERICLYLDGILQLAKVKPHALGKLLFQVVPKILTLLKTREFRLHIDSYIKKICACIFNTSDLRAAGREISNAITLSFTKEPKLSPALQVLNFSSVVEQLRKPKDHLSGAQFAFSVPIIHHILTSSVEKSGFSGRAQDCALYLLEQHAKVHHTPLMATTALHVVGEGGKLFNSRAGKVIREYSSTLYVGDTANINVLLGGLTSKFTQVRLASISSLSFVKNVEKPGTAPSKFVARIWFAQNDTNAEVSATAKELYSRLEHKLGEDYLAELLPILETPHPDIRLIAGRAIATGVVIHKPTYETTLKSLYEFYNTHNPDKDQIKYEMERVKNWVNQRKGVAVTLAQCAALPPDENAAATAKTEGKKKGAATTAETPKTTGYNTGPIVSSIFEFLIETALHDEDEDVYSEFVETGSTLVTLQGKHLAASLFSLFSAFLDRPRPTQPSRDSQVRESVAIFVGSLAQHLPAGDKQIVDVTEKLVEVLNTPSEPVRRSVAEILVKLGELLPPKESERILQKCFNNAMKAGKPGERRGAAFGFAGLTKSLGIAQVMQTLGYFEVLKKNTADADSAATDRHGSLCVFDALSRMFGRLFEPYLVHILSPLLSGFGDKNNQIREATVQAAKTIMGQLSGHCLKLVLPALLKALTDKQWRTKIGSIQLLGSMANCQPKQLSSCLPTIVPELFTVLSDTHQKVQQSAREALKAIGKVIQNPEIRMHVPVLLEALDDPAKYSSRALEALMKTHFVHHIDPASLSLIMPILHRALNDRNTDIKVKAATIVGNMCRLTEQKDLLPYLGGLMENIQIVLLDPIPSTRAIASKAVGSLVNGMGEEEFPKLIPWLLETIQNHAGFIERSGAAQGLSAVIAGLPDARFKNDLLPILLKGTLSEKAFVRQGCVLVFQFLPEAWGMPFSKYLAEVLPAVVRGLADETEIVREAALKAGQAIVSTYAQAATDLLIPLLENGLFAENWRIRQSSIELLGEFLRQVVGQRQPGEGEMRELTDIIGETRGSGILSALYLIRADPNTLVSNAALMTWKSVVSNTPKTLKDILPTLMDTIVQALASGNADKKSLATLTLGDIVRKLGDRVLSTIIPLLAKRLDSSSKEIREGVIMGLSEVMSSAPKNQISEFLNLIVPSIQNALSDSHVEVQEAAAKAFDVLYMQMGNRVLDGILQPLIRNLEDSDPEVSRMALNALKQILAVRSNIVLPFVVPKLVNPPLTLFNAKSLAAVAEVSGNALNGYFATILPAMFEGMFETGTLAVHDEEIIKAASRIVLATGEEGCSILFGVLLELIKSSDNKKYKLGACQVIGSFAKENPTESVQKAAVESMKSVIEAIPKEKSSDYVPEINNTLDYLSRTLHFASIKASAGTSTPASSLVLPGFALPGGVDTVLPLYLNAMRVGSQQGRNQILDGIRSIVSLTPTEALKPHLIHIVGPLIRIFTEKTLATTIKVSIIQTLNLLMDKGADGLKVAAAQLQTTYVKAVSDAAKEVRSEAAPGLGKLLNFGARVDFIIKELLRILPTGSSSSNAGTSVAILTAVLSLLDNLNQKTLPKPETAQSLKTTLFTTLADEDEAVRFSSARCLGTFSKLMPLIDPSIPADEQAEQLFTSLIVSPDENWRLCHGGMLTIIDICSKNAAMISAPRIQRLKDHLTTLTESTKTQVRQVVSRVIGALVNKIPSEIVEGLTGGAGSLIALLAKLLEDSANDVKVTTLQVVKYVSKQSHAVIVKYLPQLIPLILAHAKDRKQVRIKFAAERALYHLLQYYKDDKLVQRYSKVVDPNRAKDLSEFCKKILAKFEPSDDDEDNYDNTGDKAAEQKSTADDD